MARRSHKRKKTTHTTQETTENKKVDRPKKSTNSLIEILDRPAVKITFLVLLVLIPIFLAAWFRAYPAYLPATEGWATNSVHQFYQNQIRAQIAPQFRHLPEASIQEEVQKQFNIVREQNKVMIEQQITETSEHFKQQLKNDNGETYLLAIDPWTYYMDSVNIVDHGHPGEELRNGKPYELRIQAPLGVPTKTNWHSFVNIIVWRILSLFAPNMSLMGGVFWVPLIIASLATVPAFFLARRKAGNIAGFIAASIVAVHSAFLGRTPAGFADTDAYNVFFPLLVAWLFLEAFETKELWKKLTLSAVAGVCLAIYSRIWMGYWYILDILIFVIIGHILFQVAKQLFSNYQQRMKGKKPLSWQESGSWPAIKGTLILGGVFLGTITLVMTLFGDLRAILNLPLQVVGFSQLKVAANPNLWPNVLTTVAELNEVKFAGVVGSMGGRWIFWAALFGVAASLLPYKERLKGRDIGFLSLALIMTLYLISDGALQKNFLFTILTWMGLVAETSGTWNALTYLVLLAVPLGIGLLFLLGDNRKIDIKYGLLILIWFIATMYATTKGVRFTLVLVPSFAVAIGTLVGMVHKHISELLAKELEIPRLVVVPVLAVILCVFVLYTPIASAHNVAINELPSMNDAWYTSLTVIRDASQPNAIITSWWDFGHWFKAIAERPVTFDGGTQNTPMAHWVGKLLLTPDEKQSVGILRMLDCGSRTGFISLEEAMDGDTIKSKELMDEMLLTDADNARDLMHEAGVSAADAEGVLALTHCDPPEAFLITSQDMVGKSGVWGHFGSWDFKRAYIHNRLRNLDQAEAIPKMVDVLGYSEEEANQLYFAVRGLTDERAANNWISPWPGYITGWFNCQEQNVLVNTTGLGLNDTTNSSLENHSVAACPTHVRIGQQGATEVYIDAVLIDKDNPEASRFRYGYYQGTLKSSAADAGIPTKLSFAHADAEDGIESYTFTDATTGAGVLYDEERSRAMLMDPLHVESTFTRLFYLNGKYNTQYELFSDKTSFNGQRIIVWKVNWDETE